MKQFKKICKYIFLLSIVAIFLAGCGKEEKNESKEGANTLEQVDDGEALRNIEDDYPHLDLNNEQEVEAWLQKFNPDKYENSTEYMKYYFKYFEKYQYEVNWDVLWIVVESIDADGKDENGNIVRMQVDMTESDVDYFSNTMSELFKEEIEKATNGYVKVNIDKLTVPLIDKLDIEDNSITMDCFQEEISNNFSKYNTVVVTARYSTGEEPECVYIDWAGLCYGAVDDQYGYLLVPVLDETIEEGNENYIVTEDKPWPFEPWIHEFEHSLEDFAEAAQMPIASPDEAEKYGYEDVYPDYMNGYLPYYEDNMTGNVWNENENRYRGMTEAMWSAYAYYYDRVKAGH